jgi:hypothetical protein
MKIKHLKITVILVLVGLNLYSQNDSLFQTKQGIVIHSINRYCNFENLNGVLKDYEFSNLQSHISGFGLGFTSREVNSSSYLSLYFTYYDVKPLKNGTLEKFAQAQILEISNDFNIVLTKKSKWIFYPYLGYGINLCRLTLNDSSNESSFIESVSNFSLSDSKSYSSKKPIFWGSMGLGFERRIKILSDYFYLGLNIGYKVTSSTDWGYNDAPRTNFSGFEYNVKGRIEFSPRKIKHVRQRK